MSKQYYNPFKSLNFNNHTCFLSGVQLMEPMDSIHIFPEWVIERYGYVGKKFTLMDTYHSFSYEDFKLPCAANVKLAFDRLEKEVQAAFNKGYDGMMALEEKKLFLWTAKMVYGILYHELKVEEEKMQRRKSELQLSPVLSQRFALFHLMMQSLVEPISFGEKKPWTIKLVRLKYSKDIFHFRDSTVDLHFSLGTNNFGIIASFYDNGIIAAEHEDILKKIDETVLHPVQFEELCAKFLYSSYLMSYLPKAEFQTSDNTLLIQAEPIPEDHNKALFKRWDDEMFAQVLANYWEAWGLTMEAIYSPPNAPISFLENPVDYQFIEPEGIKLPF